MTATATDRNADSTTDTRVYVTVKSLVSLQKDAHGFSFLPRQAVRSKLTGRRMSSLRGRGLNFEEIRQYRPGDDIRTMDWKVTNRTGRPHVRAYTEERERPVLFVLDQRQSMFFGSIEKMKSVAAAELAALIAWRVIDVGDRIGALIFNDTLVKDVKPGRHRSDVLHILKHVERFNNLLRTRPQDVSSVDSLNRALLQTSRLVTHDHLVVVISDMAGWDETSIKLLVKMSQHNDIIVSQVIDALEKRLPDQKGLIVSDGRLQVDINGKNDTTRSQFNQYQSDVKERLKAALNKHGISVLSLMTDRATATQVRSAIGLHKATTGA
ncbi:MAG: hypothetical protein ACI92E_000547 [Oceanicoccus sp.]|jgi:uncharacterized protein (DUF58 family)